jgi:hypothetical protein
MGMHHVSFILDHFPFLTPLALAFFSKQIQFSSAFSTQINFSWGYESKPWHPRYPEIVGYSWLMDGYSYRLELMTSYCPPWPKKKPQIMSHSFPQLLKDIGGFLQIAVLGNAVQSLWQHET